MTVKASDDAELLKFWAQSQPGFRFSSADVGSARFFTEVEAHRYSLEPHIPDIVRFERWSDRDVLEAGCGIATDGLQFARAGARYTGLDVTKVALDLARRRFDLEGQEGRFVKGSVTALPFEDQSFDLVYSHGVIHHVPGAQRAVEEFHRVLKPGGVALVMIYHRGSLNYHLNIMVVRRMLAALLLLPHAPGLIARVTGETSTLLQGHRELLHQHGLRYLIDRNLFLSNNTDGPGNPLSRVFSRREALNLFRAFENVSLRTRYLNLRIYPGGQRLIGTRLAKKIERRLGWHLYVEAERFL